MRNFFGILFDQPCSMLRIFIIFKSILTKDDLIILHNIIVPNTKGPFSLVLIIHIIYNIINLSIFKLKFHKTIINIKQKREKTFMKTTLFNAYESQLHSKPHG